MEHQKMQSEETTGIPVKKARSSLFHILFRIFSILGSAVLIAVVIYVYGMQKQTSQQDISTVPEKEIVWVYGPSQESTQESFNETLEILDEKINSASSEREFLAYSQQKAYLAIINRTGSSTGYESLVEATKLFTPLYEATKSRSEYTLFNETSAFGYVYTFTHTGFARAVMRALPDDIRGSYFSYWNGDLWKTDATSTRQQQTFRGMITFVNDGERFVNLKNDKTFIANAILIEATYLDSYMNKLSAEERDRLVASLKERMLRYKDAQAIFDAPQSLRTVISDPANLAFADYVVKRAEGIEDYSALDTAYTQIQDVQGDTFGRALVSSLIQLNKLGALARGNYTEDEIRGTVETVKTQLQVNKDLPGVLRRYLAYALSSSGEWFDIYRDIFVRAQTSASLQMLFTEIGFSGYESVVDTVVSE